MGTNLLKNARAWLASQREEHASEVVTYRREEQALELRAMLSSSAQSALAALGLSIEFDTVLFVFKFGPIENGGLPFLPRAGDRIEYIANGIRRVFHVTPPAGSQQAYQFADGTGQSLKVSTVLHSSEPVL